MTLWRCGEIWRRQRRGERDATAESSGAGAGWATNACSISSSHTCNRASQKSMCLSRICTRNSIGNSATCETTFSCGTQDTTYNRQPRRRLRRCVCPDRIRIYLHVLSSWAQAHCRLNPSYGSTAAAAGPAGLPPVRPLCMRLHSAMPTYSRRSDSLRVLECAFGWTGPTAFRNESA